jgi:ABC-type polysaccharide/polyol phosphate transport system ATPase subunit
MYERAVALPLTRPATASNELILQVEGLGKAFRRFEHKPFLLRNLLSWLTRREQAHAKEFWPLRNVSFSVTRGEAIGVVGVNGSGKSTLLRLIAGAAFPTEGQIAVRGRIAPLLLLGAGFHPDMTGRECIEINGTALGLDRQELAARFDDIVRFAELEEFVDTPVRYYSSGMAARLGFAVAVHTDPDLMLIDEVLAVGDQAFQAKCTERIHQLRREGVTILFVSHSPALVRQLCDRVLWLKNGALFRQGTPDEVFPEYEAHAASS